MSGSVVMTLQAPLQAWGGPALSSAERPTRLFPSLSGVCGLVANALGADRRDELAWMPAAQLHARADRPGQRLRDFHTVGTGTKGRDRDGVLKPNNTRAQQPVVSLRWYLADAAFTVVWTPGEGLDAETAADALASPARPLYLGRKSCPPASPVLVGTTSAPPADVLGALPLMRRPAPGKVSDWFDALASPEGSVAVDIIEPAAFEDATASVEHDAAGTFDPHHRWLYYGRRAVQIRTVQLDAGLCVEDLHEAHHRRVEQLLRMTPPADPPTEP